MAHNLDLTALRAFATVAEVGGVTRAAGLLHLTQSAVSMQIKRLEEALGRALFDRAGRGVVLTADGEQLLGYARRMLALNDEVWHRFTSAAFEGEVVLGVPNDVVYPALPPVLQRFHAEFPRMKVTLVSSYTRRLKEMFARGDCDVILTTENEVDAGGRRLSSRPLVWVGAPGGQAWRQRPLRLAFETRNIFRRDVEAALDASAIEWEVAVTSEMSRTIEVSCAADLAVHALLEGTVPATLEQIDHGGALPDLGTMGVNIYVADTLRGQAEQALVAKLRQAYSG
ncbi:LysR family transcriptional regulator [Sinisalibacter aestuarii]|uniref:LysR family transcriptional regulator n=1 Tax=Sinisalibacter aestuarii TaxID=2949426 RepID=A0ABQ5LT59_9RHOB|nr:LysR family transcriptional regulator [Sinisalibacter aestuarii]GKY87277.1 LysR family transcriptional regulator [Sinisalibacter aestuarii]